MLKHFSLLKASIEKALIDLNHSVRLEDSNFDMLIDIIDVLTPIKLTVEVLSVRHANLCSADAACKYLFKQLANKN